jgi:hypothetical protein
MTNFEGHFASNQEPENRVTNKDELDALVERVKAAQQKFASFSQKQVDHIFRSAALAAADARIPLAETGSRGDRDGSPWKTRSSRTTSRQSTSTTATRTRRPAAFWPGRRSRHHHHRRADGPDLRHYSDHESHLDCDLQDADQPEDAQRHHHQPPPRARKCTCVAARLVLRPRSPPALRKTLSAGSTSRPSSFPIN